MSSHAERCPVCYGSGKYTPINDGYSTAVPQPVTCHGCGGKGWVEVGDYVCYEPFIMPPPNITQIWPWPYWQETGSTIVQNIEIQGVI
jgi:hypothetical protein